MATGVMDLPVSDKSASDICIDFPCSMCTRNVESEKFCRECGEYMCTECLQEHKRFTTRLTPHQLLDRADMKSTGLVYKCPTHPRKPLYSFCRDHGQLCCGECIEDNHSDCTGVAYIPEVAKTTFSGKDLSNLKESMNSFKLQITRTIKSREDNLSTLNKENLTAIEKIKTLKHRIVKHLDNLEEAALKELGERFVQKKSMIEIYIDSLQDLLKKINSSYDQLDASNCKNDTELFVQLKTAETAMDLNDKIFKEMQSKNHFESIGFSIDSKLCDFANLKVVRSFGETIDCHKYYNAVPENQEYNIRAGKDVNPCSIYGICRLSDGTLVISDWGNNKLKRLNKSYGLSESFVFQSRPGHVCTTDVQEVAVTVPALKQIQLISLRGPMKLEKTLKLDEFCRGIACFDDKLYITCGGGSRKGEGPGQVRIYSKNGQIISSIQVTKDNQQIFSIPLSIELTKHGNMIYVADRHNGVVQLDGQGRYISSFTSTRLMNDAAGLCVAAEDKLFVCGYTAGTVLQFLRKSASEVLQRVNGIKYPVSMYWDSAKSELMVGMEGSDTLLVAKLKKK